MPKLQFKKLWYSLDETANMLGCLPGYLIHLGLIGEIEIGFDWASVHSLMLNSDLESGYRFTGDANPNIQCNWPDYQNDPIKRIAFLLPNDIAILARNGTVKVTSAYLDKYMLHVSIREYLFNESATWLEQKHLVILEKTLISLQRKFANDNTATQANIETKTVNGINELTEGSEPKGQVSSQDKKEINTILKLLGAAIKYMAAEKQSTFFRGQKICCSEIERALQAHYPDDTRGLSERNAREKISEALQSHEE